MGTGWRRAFCTTINHEQARSGSPDVSELKHRTSPEGPTSCAKLGFFSGGGGSNPSTPRLRSDTTIRCRAAVDDVPETQTTTPKKCNSSSPRSPLKLSLFKNSFKLRILCGVCLNSVKKGQGTAIYTAECAHAFHFPCIAAHVRSRRALLCPVCNTAWNDVPLLGSQNDAVAEAVKVESSRADEPRPAKQRDFRSYDDDEPLPSLAAGGSFVSVPEADDDVEEFQGFFVTPIKSSREIVNERDSRNVELKILPETALISVGRSHETYAMVLRLTAANPARSNPASPILNAIHRARIDLVAVLDLSMNGAKLQMLKRAMRSVISSLGSGDRLSIVAFSGSSKRLLSLRRMTADGQLAARLIVDRLVTGQGTNVGEAVRKATKVLEDRREKNQTATVMLLSNGQDDRVQNTANQWTGWSHVSSPRFTQVEIPVHSFGFGEDGGYRQEPAEDAFAKCVGGLLSVVVQDLRLQLSFAFGLPAAEITAVYSFFHRPTVLDPSSVRIGDLYAGEERDLLVELRVPSTAVEAHTVMSVKSSYTNPATQEICYGKEQALVIPELQIVRSSVPKMERLRNKFITTRAIAESRRLMEHGGDYRNAHQLLASARALIIHSSAIAGDEYVRGLEAELAELQRRRQLEVEEEQQVVTPRRRWCGKEAVVLKDENGEPLTPKSAWREAEKLAKVAMMKKSLNRVSDLHGFESARF